MNFCKRCVMPDTRPGITFTDGVCSACLNYEKKKTIDWGARWEELKALADRFDGECAVAISGGKDSHFQVYVLRELLRLDVVGYTVDNFSWTKTGRKNIENISEAFGIDIYTFTPNRAIEKEMSLRTLYDLGSPMWYADRAIYAYPYNMALQQGRELLFYGENVAYEYGGPDGSIETPYANNQYDNGVVKKYELPFEIPLSMYPPSPAEMDTLSPRYLSYYVPWDSHHNYLVAKRNGFSNMEHEWKREGTIENYNQIDSPGYLINQWFKYPKYGHASVTEMASRYIRAGLMTREEAIPLVKAKDGILDERVLEDYCNFVGITKKEFWAIADRWYNTELFEQDRFGVWKPKFEVK